MKKEKVQNLLNKVVDNKNFFGTQLSVMNSHKESIFEGSSGNIDLDSRYFIASTTKIYTTAIIMKLISEEKFALDTKIETLLGQERIINIARKNGVDYTNIISVENLLSHTSGLSDYFSGKTNNDISLEKRLFSNEDKKWNLDNVIESVRNSELKFLPNAKGKAHYSDSNYQLLGGIIENSYKMKIGEVFEKEIFEKLELKNTYLYNNQEDNKLVSLNYKNTQLHIPKAMSSFGPDGGIVSNAYECNLFLHAFFNGEFFPLEFWDQMKSKYNRIFFPLQYGVGFMKFELPRIMTMFKKFPPLLGHSGLSGAFAYYSPEHELYFSGTVNQINNPGKSYRLLINILNQF